VFNKFSISYGTYVLTPPMANYTHSQLTVTKSLQAHPNPYFKTHALYHGSQMDG